MCGPDAQEKPVSAQNTQEMSGADTQKKWVSTQKIHCRLYPHGREAEVEVAK